ncbi:MAG TPA: hypothetical protein VNP92_16320 [Actinophytocola sp.]|nr:hypothetical protein [Actinophytocola sp.]
MELDHIPATSPGEQAEQCERERRALPFFPDHLDNSTLTRVKEVFCVT